jgi:hypothetical protein
MPFPDQPGPGRSLESMVSLLGDEYASTTVLACVFRSGTILSRHRKLGGREKKTRNCSDITLTGISSTTS